MICIILVGAAMELLEPYVAANKEIGGLVCNFVALATHPLLHHASLYNIGCSSTVFAVVLKLGDTEERGIGSLKPTQRLHNTEVVRTRSAVGLLRHTETYQVQEIVPHRMKLGSTIETKNKGIVRFIVAIKVDRGDCIGLGSSCNVSITGNVGMMVIIAHKHHGIIINAAIFICSLRNILIKYRSCVGIAYFGVNELAIKSGYSVVIDLSTGNIRYIVFAIHYRIIHLVGVLVG